MLGHSKTVLIIVGGVTLFGEGMPLKKLAGVVLALGGIVWYSWLRMAAASPAKAPPSTPEAKPLLSSPSSGHSSGSHSPPLSMQAAVERKSVKV